MPTWTPDPSFYPSPRMAMKAAPETLAYVAAFDPDRKMPDATRRGRRRSEVEHLLADRRHDGDAQRRRRAASLRLERLLVVPVPQRAARRTSSGATWWCRACAPRASTSSTPSPIRGSPKIVKVIEPAEVADKAGYTRPHTVHCGPEGIYVAALGNREGKGPGGVFLMDHETFDVRGQWEMDRGPQHFAYDAWWHLGHDTLVTSEWGTPDTFENGLIPEVLLGAKYGRRLHFWDLHKRKHLQTIDFGDKYQLVFELRPAHDPTKAYGFVNCVISLENLSSSIWTWYKDGDKWAVKKVIEIPAEPAEPDLLPPLLKGFKAVPPLVTDIDLSMDDKYLYVACWGTGDLQQYDVSDPFKPKLTGKVRIGGIVSKATHPGAKNGH